MLKNEEAGLALDNLAKVALEHLPPDAEDAHRVGGAVDERPELTQ